MIEGCCLQNILCSNLNKIERIDHINFLYKKIISMIMKNL